VSLTVIGAPETLAGAPGTRWKNKPQLAPS